MEVWKQVAGFPNYEVSNLGRLRTALTSKRFAGWVHTTRPTNVGYVLMTLIKPEGGRAQEYLHRLVAEAFVPGKFPGAFVNHIDGCKTNNAATNLEWATHSENVRHAFDLGLNTRKLSQSDCRAIIQLRAQGLKQREIGEHLGVTQVAVSQVLLGKVYTQWTGIKHRATTTKEGKLSLAQRIQIRHLHTQGHSKMKIAKQFGVGRTAISDLIAGKTYQLD